MYKMIKKFICIFLVLFVVSPYVFAEEKIKLRANMQSEFILKESTDEVNFITYKEMKFGDITIPEGAVVYSKNIQAQRPLRWHKSGCIICKLLKYSSDEFSDDFVDISDKDLYLVARKYERVNKKEASILATELVLMQGASFFAPGVDILYFFTKGAIVRKNHQNWFKEGVSNAYENSICWFWLKGKPIDLALGDEVNLKSINKDDVEKLKAKMVKRKFREDMQALKKDLKKEFKVIKKTELAEIKAIKKEVKAEEKFAKKQQQQEFAAEENDEILSDTDKQIEIKDVRAAAKIE